MLKFFTILLTLLCLFTFGGLDIGEAEEGDNSKTEYTCLAPVQLEGYMNEMKSIDPILSVVEEIILYDLDCDCKGDSATIYQTVLAPGPIPGTLIPQRSPLKTNIPVALYYKYVAEAKGSGVELKYFDLTKDEKNKCFESKYKEDTKQPEVKL